MSAIIVSIFYSNINLNYLEMLCCFQIFFLSKYFRGIKIKIIKLKSKKNIGI